MPVLKGNRSSTSSLIEHELIEPSSISDDTGIHHQTGQKREQHPNKAASQTAPPRSPRKRGEDDVPRSQPAHPGTSDPGTSVLKKELARTGTMSHPKARRPLETPETPGEEQRNWWKEPKMAWTEVQQSF